MGDGNIHFNLEQPLDADPEWFLAQDERASYRRYADNLRLIGAQTPELPWLLKNPSHTYGMAAMLEEFPDASFVHIYRDPAESIVSGCSLIASMGLGEGSFSPEELGAHRLRIWGLAAERMIAARATAPGRVFVDVDYRCFTTDPLATVRDVYRMLDRPLPVEVGDAMARRVLERPRDRFAVHRYRAEDFGLSERIIRERMSGYVETYGVLSPAPAEVRRV